MTIPILDTTLIKADVAEAMATREAMFKAHGFALVGGEWVCQITKRPMRGHDMRAIYEMADEAAPRVPGDARWPWPTAIIPF